MIQTPKWHNASEKSTTYTDITRAQELLGWTPEIALDDGLARTIDNFEELLGATSPAQ
jgi:nucleoside-diphosphate-sugar epimerase